MGKGQVTRITNTILGRMQTASPCNVCGGTGQIIDNRPPNSDAQGFLVEEETVSIKNTCWRCRWYAIKSHWKRKCSPWKTGFLAIY